MEIHAIIMKANVFEYMNFEYVIYAVSRALSAFAIISCIRFTLVVSSCMNYLVTFSV